MTRCHEPEFPGGQPSQQAGADGSHPIRRRDDGRDALRVDVRGWDPDDARAGSEHPAVRISYDERLDFLTALFPGEVLDEPYDEELMTAFAWRQDEESGETCERAWLFTATPMGR